jgi:hypothetical protein
MPRSVKALLQSNPHMFLHLHTSRARRILMYALPKRMDKLAAKRREKKRALFERETAASGSACFKAFVVWAEMAAGEMY